MVNWICTCVVFLYLSTIHIYPPITHTHTQQQHLNDSQDEMRQYQAKWRTKEKSRVEKKELSKWQMLHIAKLDIIEFNVVKWFCSGEYIKHISIRIWKRGREREKKRNGGESIVCSKGMWNARSISESKLDDKDLSISKAMSSSHAFRNGKWQQRQKYHNTTLFDIPSLTLWNETRGKNPSKNCVSRALSLSLCRTKWKSF